MLEFIVSGPVVVWLLIVGGLLVLAFPPDMSSFIVYLLPLGVFACLVVAVEKMLPNFLVPGKMKAHLEDHE